MGSLTGSKGFTLLEILISLAISGIVLSGIFYVFDTSNKSYIVQEDIARMQQNIRIAKYYIEKDLRMAAYGIRDLTYNQAAVEPLVFKNNVDDDADVLVDTDTLSIAYTDDAADDCAPDTPDPSVHYCDENPQLLLNVGMPVNSANAKVQEEFADSPFSDWLLDCTCEGTVYTGPHPNFKVIITTPDGSTSDVLVVTQVTQNGGGVDDFLQNAKVTVDTVEWENKVLNEYPQNSTIKFFNDESLVTARYFIDDEGYLRREVGGIATKVAENMEDLQMAFCGDYNGDGTVDVNDDADWYDNDDLVGGQIQASDLDEIRYVRVTLLARTGRQHQGVSSIRPAIEDREAALASDRYSRRQLSFTVKIRNLGLND